MSDDPRSHPFARWLDEQTKAAGFSYRETARRAGLDQSAVSAYVAGKRRPLPEACRRLARVFAVSEDTVLTLAGHRAEPPAPDDAHAAFLALLREQPPEAIAEIERWVRPFLRAYWTQRAEPRSSAAPSSGLALQLRWDDLLAANDPR
ncbi:MAG: helix-turn-helix transcriptional regulator [Dehalococcoidia bacterium]|nr:helix-turn-helix transcriptional regulator [Dehalococcoidia bacterium]